MAFTRDNLGQTSSFTRNGATTFSSTPNFRVFEGIKGAATFSLSNDWTITSVGGSTPKLNFNYNGVNFFEITSAGVGNITLDYLRMNDNTSTPNANAHIEGDLIKINGELYVNVGQTGEQNSPT
jgi:hypothetical protein